MCNNYKLSKIDYNETIEFNLPQIKSNGAAKWFYLYADNCKTRKYNEV